MTSNGEFYVMWILSQFFKNVHRANTLCFDHTGMRTGTIWATAVPSVREDWVWSRCQDPGPGCTIGVGFSQWACMHGLAANGLTHPCPASYSQHLTPCSVGTVHGAGLQQFHLSFCLLLWLGHLGSLYFLFQSWRLPPLGAAPCTWDSSCWEKLRCHWTAPLDRCPPSHPGTPGIWSPPVGP